MTKFVTALMTVTVICVAVAPAFYAYAALV